MISQNLACVHRSSDQTSPCRIYALDHIQRLKEQGEPIQAAVASRTDEPHWAKICMDHLILSDGTTTLSNIFDDLVEIHYGSKVGHIERLHRRTGIAFEDMAFFDNEQGNIRDVEGELPVKCYYTPQGMTREAWNQALKDFDMEA